MASRPAFVTPLFLGARPSAGSPLLSSSAASSTSPLHFGAPVRRHAPRMAFTSIGGVLTPPPMALPQDITVVIRAVYDQLFGNAHLMESDFHELASFESTFKLTRDVREFVRAVALSEPYKARFFDSVSQYRAVELAFKHLLGRAPESRAEFAQVSGVLLSDGYEAFVSLLIDSEEYNENFGYEIVPYGKYKGCYSSNELFNRSVAIRLAPSQSDKGRANMLLYSVLAGCSPSWLTISKGLPAGTDKGTGYSPPGRHASFQRNRNAPIRVPTKIPGGVVFY